MLSGICTACGNGELGSGRWPKVALVGVGVVGDVAISSFAVALVEPGILSGLNVDAITEVDGCPEFLCKCFSRSKKGSGRCWCRVAQLFVVDCAEVVVADPDDDARG